MPEMLVLNNWYSFSSVKANLNSKMLLEFKDGDLYEPQKGYLYYSELDEKYFILHNNSRHAGTSPSEGIPGGFLYSWTLGRNGTYFQVKIISWAKGDGFEGGEEVKEYKDGIEKFNAEIETMINSVPTDVRKAFREIDLKRIKLMSSYLNQIDTLLKKFEGLLIEKDFLISPSDLNSSNGWLLDNKLLFNMGEFLWDLSLKKEELKSLKKWAKGKTLKSLKSHIDNLTKKDLSIDGYLS